MEASLALTIFYFPSESVSTTVLAISYIFASIPMIMEEQWTDLNFGQQRQGAVNTNLPSCGQQPSEKQGRPRGKPLACLSCRRKKVKVSIRCLLSVRKSLTDPVPFCSGGPRPLSPLSKDWHRVYHA